MLDQFYEDNKVPEGDRIPLAKNVVLIVPSKDYDVSSVASNLGLSPFEISVTWPKRTVEMLPEVCAVKPKFVLQVGKCWFPKKFPFVKRPEGAQEFRDKAVASSADGYVVLHHHDEFSIKDALGTVGQLTTLLKAQRRSFCCVTNHGSVGGWIRQYNACKKAGIKAIFGMEAYISNYRGDDPEVKRKCRSAAHLVLMAKNQEGFDNIIRIHNDAWINGFYYSPRTTWWSCRKWGKGIIATTACMGGEVPRALMQDDEAQAERIYNCYKAAFDEVYVELQIIEYEMQKEVNHRLIKFARKVGAPLILACDSHYLEPEHADTHDVLMCVRQYKTVFDMGQPTDDENGDKADVWAFDVRNLFYRNADQMKKVFVEGYTDKRGNRQAPFRDDVFTEEVLAEAMANTRAVAVSTDCIELDSEIKLPKLYPDAKERLLDLVNQGFTKRKLKGKTNALTYAARRDHEYEVICKLGWADYFLVMEKIVTDAKAKFGEWAVGYGRGSAAGSLVSYCLGLTDIDPIEHGLLFERFLDEGRPDPPDIDTDFDPRIRDAVKRDIVKVFGEKKVCSIGTYQTYKTKAVILDVTRALNEDVNEANRVTKKIDSLSQFEDEEGESHKVDDMPFDELCEHYPDLAAYFEKNPLVRHHAEILRNQVKNMGTHAGGVIISDTSLQGRIPVLWDKPGNKEERQIISAWAEGQERSELSSVGLVKFDILGLNNLPVIGDCVKLVEKTTGVILTRENMPIDDGDVIRECSKDDLVGIFQLESPATRPVVDAVGMESLNDVSAITSLIRPGPRDMGMDKEYADRKNGKPYDSIACIEPIMAETYGVMCYQEQVMNISKALCGFDGPMANRLRKGMGKKIQSIMDEMKQKFFNGAQPRIDSGEVTLKEVEGIFELISAFAKYGFNKSHAVAYSAISTVELWLKHHYPAEYMTALINNSKLGKKKHGADTFISYINYARRRGITVLPPDINRSSTEFTIHNGDILFSLAHIKYVAAQAPVVASFQPFSSIEDFYERVKVETTTKTGKKSSRRPNKTQFLALVKAGALDSFGSRNDVMEEYYRCRKKKGENPPHHTKAEWEDFEREVTGLCLSKTPLMTKYREMIKEKEWNAIGEAHSKKKVKVFGRIIENKPHTSKAGNSMNIIEISDDIDTLTFFVFQTGKQQFLTEIPHKGVLAAVPLDHFKEDDSFSETCFYDDRGIIEVVEEDAINQEEEKDDEVGKGNTDSGTDDD